MKNLILLFVIILVSCSGTKRVVETQKSKESTEAIVKAKDSIITEKTVAVVNDSIAKNEIIKEEEPLIEYDTTFETFNHSSWNNLLREHVSNSGNVNYLTFKNNRKTLLNYIDSLGENMPTKIWSKEDKLAYWINAYNAMTIDLILRHYPIKSIKDIDKPWEQRYWKLDEKWYNLNEIEHKILRKMDESRIHFAIVCASVSCPKLLNEAYTASNLDEQLTKVTKGFLSDSERNSITENNLKLSKIFQWFAKDFKQNGSLIDFLNQYSDVQISAKAKKSFKSYNWDLNE